jgi:hypothetical protein
MVGTAGVARHLQPVCLQCGFEQQNRLISTNRPLGRKCDRTIKRGVQDVVDLGDFAQHQTDHICDGCVFKFDASRSTGDLPCGGGRGQNLISATNDLWSIRAKGYINCLGSGP